MTTSWNGETAASGETVPIYDIATLQQFLNDTITNYFSLENDENLERIILPRKADGSLEPV